jgi:DNA replication protein DnaC
MAKLVALRDQGQREQARREAARITADSVASKSIADAVNTAKTPKSPRAITGPETVPAAALALRNAARLPAFDPNARFDCVASDCVSTLRRQLGERYAPELVALDKVHVYDASGRQAAAIAQVRAFIAGIEGVLREARGLVLYGSVGTGKDHFLAAALYRVAGAGIPTAWVSGHEVFARIRDSMDSHEREAKVLQPWLQPFVLGISDPVSPRGDLSDWDARVLAGLLDQRYRHRLPTWLTMNATGEADAKSKLTALIWDRFQEDAEIIPCFWESFRGRRKPTNPPVRAQGHHDVVTNGVTQRGQ